MSKELNLESESDIEVERFVQKVLLDMEDENLSSSQQVMVVDLLSESVLSE